MNKSIFATICFYLIISGAMSQNSSIGGYNVYFGDMHNHSDVSDGDLLDTNGHHVEGGATHVAGDRSPQKAYLHARDSDLDFFGLSDHSDNSGNINNAKWNDIIYQANLYNDDGNFVTFYGFEWTHPLYGHVNVFNSETFCYATQTPTNSFNGFLGWLYDNPNAIAFFNHPGFPSDAQIQFEHFIMPPSNQLIGIELWNNWYDFNKYNGSYGGKIYYEEANAQGWKVGAWGGSDEHGGEWGTNTNFQSRVAILANSLTRVSLLSALKARRFYSTTDANLYLSFKIDGLEMGSSVVEGSSKNIRIQVADGDVNDAFYEIILYNQAHSVVKRWPANEITSSGIVTFNYNMGYGDYFYVKVKQNDGNGAISSPIWALTCSATNYIGYRSIIQNETISGCAVNLNNVTISNNANIIIDVQDNVVFQSNFEVQLGSSMEVK